ADLVVPRGHVPGVADVHGAPPVMILSVLSLAGVTKRFGARTVLNEVSLEVRAGEYVAILGESGIGKSTLLNVIAGLEPVDAGRMFLDGRALTAMDDDALTLLRRSHY